MPLDFEKIRRLRESKGLSLQDAATAANLSSRQQWHQIESGSVTNIKLGTLEAIAKALGVTPAQLLK
jgi:transcriptional regulator with XRE-family HTH domain